MLPEIEIMTSRIRRSMRLQEKVRSFSENQSASVDSPELPSANDGTEYNEKEVSIDGKRIRKSVHHPTIDSSIQVLSKRGKKRKCFEEEQKLESGISSEKIKHRQCSSRRLVRNRSKDMSEIGKDSVTDKLPKKIGRKNEREQIRLKTDDTTSSNSSDDEWEEVGDEFDQSIPQSTSLEITIKKPKQKLKSVESVGTRRARYIRQHVYQKVRERQSNCHKMHLLCYIAHLRIWARILALNEDLLSLTLSLIPEEYILADHRDFDVAKAQKFLDWFGATYHLAKKVYLAKNSSTDEQVKRMEELIADQVYENDRDLAFLLFLCLTALKQTTRICLSCQPLPFKLATLSSCSEHVEMLINYYGSGKLTADDYAGWPQKLEETVKKIVVPFSGNAFKGSGADIEAIQKIRKRRKNKNDDNSSVRKKEKSTAELNKKRDYWIEYWNGNENRWICLDPWEKLVDKPEAVEANATPPMHYVLCIDNEYGMRDVTARYASKYLMPEVRRLWVSQDWWTKVLKTYRSKYRERERLEDVAIEEFLFSKPKPQTVLEFKNHPLYALEKDLSKYETIYPENQQPIGQISGFDIYPRKSVHRLDGAINWMKQFRSIKPGEQPYRVIQGRSRNRGSAEYQESKTVDLYGRWQTVPYVTPKVVNGRVPRNEFGNLYVYKSSMIPDGCVHLRLNGLVAIARQLNIDCVPAVVGWNHRRGGSHPVLEGCVVLKEHEKELRDAWSKHYEKKKVAREMKQKQMAIKNWRRLIKGILTMQRVRAKFVSADLRLLQSDEKLESVMGDEVHIPVPPTNDMATLAWPQTAFNLPGAG